MYKPHALQQSFLDKFWFGHLWVHSKTVIPVIPTPLELEVAQMIRKPACKTKQFSKCSNNKNQQEKPPCKAQQAHLQTGLFAVELRSKKDFSIFTSLTQNIPTTDMQQGDRGTIEEHFGLYL